MLGDAGYDNKWKAKLEWYSDNGVLHDDEGGGEIATLLTSTEIEGIDQHQIASLIKRIKSGLERRYGVRVSWWRSLAVSSEARSAYLLQGPSRTEWEHSIPAVEQLRDSITFRTLRDPQAAVGA
jgi:hypothetical protein